LIWEVKTPGGSGGLHDANNTYSWFNSNTATNGGNAGTANGGACTGSGCDTEKFVAAVNAAGLCGFSDWRLPTVGELLSIIDLSIATLGPVIDTAYFPNTLSATYWSASQSATANAERINFFQGHWGAEFKSANRLVRLVRGGQ
jgi:hypothetical protein